MQNLPQSFPFRMVAGTSLDKKLDVKCWGVYVSNYTAQWVEVPDANEFVPPNTRQIIALAGTYNAKAKFQAPDGVVQPASIAGQTCFFTYTERVVQPSGGVVGATALPAVTQLERFPKVSIPVSSVANTGREILLTNYDRAIWIDNGTQFWSTGHEFFDLKSFNAKGDGVADDTQPINDWLAAGAGNICIAPAGRYLFTGPMAIPTDTIVRGAGMRKTIFTTAAAGDGFTSIYAINSTSRAHILIEDLQVKSTHVASTGGGISQVSGTVVQINRVYTSGFKYGIIFDQTELGHIDECYLEFPLTAGVWQTNGPDHTVGGGVGVTNQNSVRRCQFNLNPGTYGVIDDGGINHDYADCNFNGGLTAMRIAGMSNIQISSCEWEGQTGIQIICATTTFNLGGAVGGNGGLLIENNNFASAAGIRNMNVQSCDGLVLIGNAFGGSGAATPLVNVASVNRMIAMANVFTGASTTMFDGRPTRLWSMGNTPLGDNYFATTTAGVQTLLDLSHWGVAVGDNVELRLFPARASGGTATGIVRVTAEGAATQHMELDTGGTAGASTVRTRQGIRPGTDANAFQNVCTIFAGTGVPNNGNGQNGDYYFRSDGGAATRIYHKEAGAWAATAA